MYVHHVYWACHLVCKILCLWPDLRIPLINVNSKTFRFTAIVTTIWWNKSPARITWFIRILQYQPHTLSSKVDVHFHVFLSSLCTPVPNIGTMGNFMRLSTLAIQSTSGSLSLRTLAADTSSWFGVLWIYEIFAGAVPSGLADMNYDKKNTWPWDNERYRCLSI